MSPMAIYHKPKEKKYSLKLWRRFRDVRDVTSSHGFAMKNLTPQSLEPLRAERAPGRDTRFAV